MKNILIANSKGGSGKTTIATNLAGYFASLGKHVMLSDLDRQQSSAQWLKRRPVELPEIHAYIADPEWIITDSPAGIRSNKLSDAVKRADCIIVPVQPSAFDIGATSDFLDLLISEKSVSKHKTFVGLVGMRVNPRTHAATRLTDFLEYTGFQILTNLRNAQVYANVAEHGLSLFDVRPSLVAQDIEQWTPILDWVNEVSDSET